LAILLIETFHPQRSLRHFILGRFELRGEVIDDQKEFLPLVWERGRLRYGWNARNAKAEHKTKAVRR
jgi:hypothetical protein